MIGPTDELYFHSSVTVARHYHVKRAHLGSHVETLYVSTPTTIEQAVFMGTRGLAFVTLLRSDWWNVKDEVT